MEGAQTFKIQQDYFYFSLFQFSVIIIIIIISLGLNLNSKAKLQTAFTNVLNVETFVFHSSLWTLGGRNLIYFGFRELHFFLLP